MPVHLDESIHSSLSFLSFRTTTSLKWDAVPMGTRIQGSKTCVSLNSRLESKKGEEEEEAALAVCR